jgi:hypothetical protein
MTRQTNTSQGLENEMHSNTAPMKARWTISRVTMLVASAVMLAACGRDVSAPAVTDSQLAPTDASKALVGVVDGVYSITIDPDLSYTLPLGKSYMTLPAHSVCDLQTSGYGPQYWNTPCTPEHDNITITAIVRGAQTDNPSVDFSPAMRFNPSMNVSLHIYVTNAATLTNMTVMKYCPTIAGLASLSQSLAKNLCIDESKTDASLFTTIDRSQNLIWRRIKHFSGYLIAE